MSTIQSIPKTDATCNTLLIPIKFRCWTWHDVFLDRFYRNVPNPDKFRIVQNSDCNYILDDASVIYLHAAGGAGAEHAVGVTGAEYADRDIRLAVILKDALDFIDLRKEAQSYRVKMGACIPFDKEIPLTNNVMRAERARRLRKEKKNLAFNEELLRGFKRYIRVVDGYVGCVDQEIIRKNNNRRIIYTEYEIRKAKMRIEQFERAERMEREKRVAMAKRTGDVTRAERAKCADDDTIFPPLQTYE